MTASDSRRHTRLTCLSAGAAALLTLGGCYKGNDQYVELQKNPSPELVTLSQRPDDVRNRWTVTNDTNLRIFNDDLNRAMLLDRPSRLTNYAMPY